MEVQTDTDKKALVYYDTNIWVSYMLGQDDNFYNVCKPLIEDIEHRRRVAVVSYLTVMESIHAIRRRVAIVSLPAESGRTISQRETLARNCVNKFVKFVGSLSIQKKIIIVRPTQSIATHHLAVLNKLKTIFGRVDLNLYCTNCQRRYLVQRHSDNCPSCGGSLTYSNRYEYRGLSHADIAHAYFARYGGASLFYSTDKSFDDLSDDPDFLGSIAFTVLKNK